MIASICRDLPWGYWEVSLRGDVPEVLLWTLPCGQCHEGKRLWYILLYNFGRAVTYTILGALFGIVGAQFFIGGYQQILSVCWRFTISDTFFAKIPSSNSFFLQ